VFAITGIHNNLSILGVQDIRTTWGPSYVNGIVALHLHVSMRGYQRGEQWGHDHVLLWQEHSHRPPTLGRPLDVIPLTKARQRCKAMCRGLAGMSTEQQAPPIASASRKEL
jgi:hypothetical protein